MTPDTVTKVRVRDITRSDFDELRELMIALTGGDVPEGQAGESILYEILALTGTSLIGAECPEGRIVSTAMISITPNLAFGGRPLARVENVVTLKAFRGQGYARAVMAEAIARARRADCANVTLLMGREWDAKGFYTKLGFEDDQLGLILRLPGMG